MAQQRNSGDRKPLLEHSAATTNDLTSITGAISLGSSTESEQNMAATPKVTFFDLPPEIRNNIYAYALREDSHILPGRGREPGL